MSEVHSNSLTLTNKLEPGWAEAEFGEVDLGDRRRNRRLVRCLEAMTDQPGASIPKLSNGWSETKAFYRLMDCDQLTEERIFDAHRQATLRRSAISEDSVFLAVQDTTTANFTTHEKLAGQGPISNHESVTGLHIHSTLLIGAQSAETFGLLGSKIYSREADKRRQQTPGSRNRERIEEKESYRWMESFELARNAQVELGKLCPSPPSNSSESPIRVISVGDREADIYELLLEAKAHCEKDLGFLVRSQHNRELADGEQKRLWAELESSPCRGNMAVHIAAKGDRKSSEVDLEIRFQKVTIQAPAHKRKYLGMTEDVELWAIELREIKSKKEGILWRLLTTVEIKAVEQARQVSRWYSLRWQIEEFHRVLKTGCRVEKRRFQNMDRMRPMIALDMVVACLILNLRQASRCRPEAPAGQWLGHDEMSALIGYYKHMEKNRKLTANLDADTLAIGRAVSLIARLGGHLGRKCDGPPGAEVLWRGITELRTITTAYLAFVS